MFSKFIQKCSSKKCFNFKLYFFTARNDVVEVKSLIYGMSFYILYTYYCLPLRHIGDSSENIRIEKH